MVEDRQKVLICVVKSIDIILIIIILKLGMEATRERNDKDCWPREYDYLTEYMCDEIGASMEKNVCALAVDLARINNITMGELFTKYQG